MITIYRIELSEFDAIAEEWNLFVQSSSNDNIFLTHEWLTAWWEAFESDARKFYFLLARDAYGAIAGGFPMQVVTRRFARVLHLKILQFIGRGPLEHETEYNTFMTPPTLPGLEADVYAAVAEHLCVHQDDWDLLVLLNLLSTHASTPILEKELKQRFKTVRSKQESNYVIALPPTYESFLAGLSRNQRRDLKKGLKMVHKHHAPTFAVISANDDLESYLKDYYQLVQQRHNWTPSKAKEAFMASLCKKLAKAGWLRCYLLMLNNIPAATQLGFRYNKKFYCYKAAFNPAFSALSPGKALFGFALRNEIERGSTEMDYLIGEYGYKGYWCNDVRAVDYIQIVGKRLASRFKVLLATGLRKTAHGVQAARSAVKKRLVAIS
jgi:CelD/BcsL family acetyltransferase involved in cellulose biosynthesis